MSHLNENGSNRTDNENPQIEELTSNKLLTFLQTLLIIIFDIGLPLIFYYTLSTHIWIIWALVISIVPPIISIIFNFIFRKQFDVLGMLSIIALISAIILFSFQNVPKFYSLGVSFVFGVVSLVLVISIIPIKVGSFEMRPVLFYCSKLLGISRYNSIGRYRGLTMMKGESISECYERYWKSSASFRRYHVIVTAGYGFVFLLELLIHIIIVCNNGVDDNDRIFFYSFPILGVFIGFYSCWALRKGFEEDNPNHA
ncbi:225_t:CDS:1 [Dentiscutata erythropus]|uniref:225_t:CDS:1 n=1 Tax=Dentiscutata erythropus TaxID=1348616 RepID=A0A9N8YVX6_9GLOM|nr:225_t:CDS:1 [Dentiscutata erythropus]